MHERYGLCERFGTKQPRRSWWFSLEKGGVAISPQGEAEIEAAFICIEKCRFLLLRRCVVEQACLMSTNLDTITAALAGELKPQRFMHTLGTVETAVVLARLHGFDVDRACVAALLHDCGRGLTPEQEEAIARTPGSEVPPEDLEYPALLHAGVGRVLARQRFGISDPEVLSAIAYHPTGCSNPGNTLRVLMAADYCEPTRQFDGVEELRVLVRRDFDAGLREILKRKVEHVRSMGGKPHSRALLMIEAMGAN